MKRTILIAMLGTALFAQNTPEQDAADRAKIEAMKAKIAAQVAQVDAQKTQDQAIQLRKAAISQTTAFLSGVVNGPLVKSAPYSAEAITETTQSLSDGNRIEQKTSSKQCRDGEGRERREESSGMNVVFITDPVAKISYTLHPESKTAEKSSTGGNFIFRTMGPVGADTPLTVAMRNTNTLTAVATATSTDGQINMARRTTPTIVQSGNVQELGVSQASFGAISGPNVSFSGGPVMFASASMIGGKPKVEDLGSRNIEGVQASGTRTTMTIPAGQIGNVRPIDIVDESWYSPDLQMTVMTRHNDPRSGETVYKLTNIQRIEPLRTMFEVPADYTLLAPSREMIKLDVRNTVEQQVKKEASDAVKKAKQE